MNFVKQVIESGGSIHPIILPAELTNGTGTFNPSIYNDNGQLLMNIRHCQVTIYHSEKSIFEHQWGPLVYVHPENDQTLTTTNYFCHLDSNLNIIRTDVVDFSRFNEPPIWNFIGLEDCRVFRWEGKLYLCGVRRDTTPNGVGRMEMSEIEITENAVTEVSRFRIPAPGKDDTYCEKNWMPILDLPYQFIKWCNPTEIVTVNPIKKTCTSFIGTNVLPLQNDLRGGSQVLSWKDQGYFTLIHETYLFNSEAGRKNGIYRHRFVLWDKHWNIIKISDPFSFGEAHIEFAAGMCYHGDDLLITFGIQDNAAYILRCPLKLIENALNV